MTVLTLSHPLSSLVLVQSGFGWHMRDGGYMMGRAWGMWPLVHILFWLLLLAAIVAATVAIARGLGGGRSRMDGESRPSALDQLDERYARGEIDRDDYLQRKRDISER